MMAGEGEEHTAQAARLQLKVATRIGGMTPTTDLHGQMIVFTHVGKTGGTTLDHIIRAATSVAGMKVCRPRPFRAGMDPSQRIQELLHFDQIDFDQISVCDYVSGHFPFGIHTRLSRPSLYVTLLRDPVMRLLSNIRFGLDRGKWPRDVSVAALVEQGRLIDNMQTRQLAGVADRTSPCTGKTLALALENLRSHYAVVGVTERFDDTVKSLITLFGWPDIAYSDLQVSRAPSDHTLESKVRDAAERYFAFDMELHAYASARPTPWSSGILKGATTGNTRQDSILVTSPMIMRDGRPIGLVSRKEFDTRVCLAVQRQGGEILLV
jgi:hypothetical protein